MDVLKEKPPGELVSQFSAPEGITIAFAPIDAKASHLTAWPSSTVAYLIMDHVVLFVKSFFYLFFIDGKLPQASHDS